VFINGGLSNSAAGMCDTPEVTLPLDSTTTVSYSIQYTFLVFRAPYVGYVIHIFTIVDNGEMSIYAVRNARVDPEIDRVDVVDRSTPCIDRLDRLCRLSVLPSTRLDSGKIRSTRPTSS
jgi:hypothetical protein